MRSTLKFGNHVTVHRPIERASDRPPAPQGNQCLLSHFLASLGDREETNCTSMLWSTDSCQNRVSADQYHLTISRAQVLTHRGRVSFWSYPLTSYLFSNDRRLKFIFLKFKWNMPCLCAAQKKILTSNWPRTRKFSQLLQAGKTVAFDFCFWLFDLWCF